MASPSREDGRATVVIPQMTVPSGSAEVTARRVLPGVNVDFGWEVIKDVFNIELLIANNFVQDQVGGGSHHELATGLTAAFQLTKKLEFFAEWDAFYPTGGLGSAAPRNYAVGATGHLAYPHECRQLVRRRHGEDGKPHLVGSFFLTSGTRRSL